MLTFRAKQGDSLQRFTIPAKVGDSEFTRLEPNGVIYADETGKESAFVDLNVFTDYQAPKAKSRFPALAAEAYQPEFHNTAFLGRVSLIPIDDAHGERHTSPELWVKDVKVSNDRPPTQFGSEGQRSHTVAWTLLRAALQNLGGQPLDAFIVLLGKLAQRFEAPTREGFAQAAANVLFERLHAALAKLKDTAKPRQFAYWQRAASELVSNFVHAYQLSEAATYADGRAIGHGEVGHMAILRDAEADLRAGHSVEDRLPEVTAAAVGLLDVKLRLKHEVLGAIFHHWINQLYLAFPRVMARHLKNIVRRADLLHELKKLIPQPLDEITGKPTTLDVVSEREPYRTALNAKDQSSFVANVVVVPTASVLRVDLAHDKIDHRNAKSPSRHTVAHGSYTLDQIQIEAVTVANDRPDTRFGARQRSHTVAWSLIRRHLAGFAGKPARTLATFVKNELNTLKYDIDSQAKNKHITFDASGEAANIAENVMLLMADSDGHPLYQWQIRLSELIETYVTLYQLSRSATYSKEEQPQSHGEARALRGLQDLETELAAGQVANPAALFAQRRKEIVAWSVALIDAVIATSSLQPQHWLIAIEHWLRLLSDQYPHVTKLPGFTEAVESRISVMEPENRLLAGYENPKQLSPRDKVLIKLYENARHEVKRVPDTFKRDLRTSIRLQLADLEQDDEDWGQCLNDLEPGTRTWRRWQKTMVQYFPRPQREDKDRPVPDDTAIEVLIGSVKAYFAAVQKDRKSVIDELFTQLSKRVGNELLDFVKEQQADIKQAIGAGFDEALELSSLATIKNYQNWYELLSSIDAKLPITYKTLSEEIKARLIPRKRIARRRNKHPRRGK